MEKLTQRKRLNIPLVVFFTFLIILFTGIQLVSAYSFDNIRSSLINDSTTSEYGKIEVKNTLFGLDWFKLDKVASIELKENSEVCDGTSCYAEKEIIMYEDGQLIDNIRFLEPQIVNGVTYWIPTSIRSYGIYIKQGNKLTPYNYEVVKGNSNGIKYDLILKGEVGLYQEVDWQIKTQSTDWIEDWAIWGSSLKNGTMAYFNMDDAGTEAVDQVLSLYNLSASCSAGECNNWTTNGLINGAWSRDNTPSTNMLNSSTLLADPLTNISDVTVSLWFKLDTDNMSNANGRFFMFPGDTAFTRNRFSLGLDGGDRLRLVYIGDAGTLWFIDSLDMEFLAGTWYHAAVRKEGTNVSTYINGVTVNGTAGTVAENWGYSATSPSLFEVGRGEATNNFIGSIDEFSIHNRSISLSELGDIYNSGVGLTYSEDITITLNSPIDGANLTNKTVDFSCTADTGDLNNVTNISLYHNESGTWEINQTNTTTKRQNSTSTFMVDFQDFESIEWNCFACNNASTTACSFGTNQTFNLKTFAVAAENYSQNTTEGNSETFYINISTASLSLTSANLTYNSTDYAATITQESPTNFTLSRILTVPQVSANTNITFNWSFEFSDSSTGNSVSHNQSVLSFGVDNCSTFTNQLFNSTLYDEDDQSQLDGTTQQTSMKIDLNLTSLSGVQIANFSSFFNRTNPASVCLQTPVGDSEYRMDGLIEYSSLDRFTEFYHFQNYSLDSDNTNINISLYNLNSSRGEEFKITYKDSNFVPVDGALMDIQRKYVEEGVFKTTERPKTGAEGYTIAHLVINDVIYNIIIIKDGAVLATFSDVVADCQNPALTSCEINLNSFGSSVLPESFATSNDIVFTLGYNESTRVINSIFSITSGATSTVNLNVTLYDTLGNTTVCEDSIFASGGELTCTAPLSFGNSTLVAILSKDGEQVGYTIVVRGQSPSDIYGDNLIFIGLIISIGLIGIGVSDNPMVMGVMMMIASLALVGLNIVYTPSIVGVGATILWFMVAIILILVKGSNRQ